MLDNLREGASLSILFFIYTYCSSNWPIIQHVGPADVRDRAKGYDLQQRLTGSTTGVMGSSTCCYLMNHRTTLKAR